MISTEAKKKTIDFLQSLIGEPTLSNHEVLLQAFVHKSFAMDFVEEIKHNERLEFLWDAVLDTIIAKELFNDFPQYTESKLTLYKISLVREETLSLVATDIGIDKYVFISKGEEKSEWRKKDAILSDTLEAIIGYLFIEWGYDLASTFVLKHIYSYINKIQDLLPVKSYKARVQEFTQQQHKALPIYQQSEHTVEKTGNVLEYKSELIINARKVAEGIAPSKKKAQELAAKAFRENKTKGK